MPTVQITIAERHYSVNCADGQEGRLHELAALVDKKVHEASGDASGLTEVRSLLFASLLLADELSEKDSVPKVSETEDDTTQAYIHALERLADRTESLASALEV